MTFISKFRELKNAQGQRSAKICEFKSYDGHNVKLTKIVLLQNNFKKCYI